MGASGELNDNQFAVAQKWRRIYRVPFVGHRLLSCAIGLANSRYITIGVYIVIFTIIRIPFYTDRFIITLDGDYSSYAWEAGKLFQSIWPDFSIRPPLFPMLLAIARLAGSNAFDFLLAQSCFTALSGITFILTINRWCPNFTALALLSLVGAHCSEQWLEYETLMQPDILYANLLLLFIAACAMFASTQALRYAIAASILAGLAIWTRPTGILLFGVELILACFVLFRGRSKRRMQIPYAAALLLPSMFLALLLSALNYFGPSHRLELSIWGEENLAAATMYFWHPVTGYPDALNDDLARIEGLVPVADVKVIRGNWRPEVLYQAFYSAYTTYFRAQRNFPRYVPGPSYWSNSTYLKERPIIRSVAFAAIARNFGLYFKFVYTNLYIYLTNNTVQTVRPLEARGETFGKSFYGSALRERQQSTLRYHQLAAAHQYVYLFGKIGKAEVEKGTESLDLQKNEAFREIAELWFRVHRALYRNIIWALAFLSSLVPITWLALRRSRAFFVFGSAFLTVAASALLVSVVEISVTRYSVPTSPQFYLCGAFFLYYTLWLAGIYQTVSGSGGRPRRDLIK